MAAPSLRTVVFSPAQIQIEDTWSVSGLCGTGSHHFVADNVFVKAERTCLTLSDGPCLDEPLLRIPPPPVFAFQIASIAIGIAQGALDDILALSAAKVPLLSRSPLTANPLFQHQLGAVDAKLRAARALLYADAASAWATAVAGAPFTPRPAGPDAFGGHVGCRDRGVSRRRCLRRGGWDLALLRQPAPAPLP